MEKRQAWTTFTKWVERAGGHVRGTKRGPSAPSAESRYGEVWPLHLVDVALHEQISLLLELLCRLPLIIEHYLSAFVFPQTMLHQTMKLSTNAQVDAARDLHVSAASRPHLGRIPRRTSVASCSSRPASASPARRPTSCPSSSAVATTPRATTRRCSTSSRVWRT